MIRERSIHGGTSVRLFSLLLVFVSLAALPSAAAEAIVDGGFEAASPAWVETSNGGYPIRTYDDPFVAHTGSAYAWLGGYANGIDVLYQDVTIPANADTAKLRFWRLIEVEAPEVAVQDTLVVSVRDITTGAILATLATFTNLDTTGDWVPTVEYDLSAFRGRTVRLQFNANTNDSNDTSFFIDDVTLTTGPSPPRLANISTRLRVLTGDDVMIAGFIIGGAASKKLVINVAGPSLTNAGIANPLANPTLTLVRSSDGAVVASNDNWQSAPNEAEIQASGFAPGHPLEPAILATLAPGAYTAIVQGAGGATGVALVGVFEVDRPEVPLINISTRGQVLTGNDVMIAGFIVQGTGPQTVVLNVAGPSLVNAGIASALANPTLTLVRSSDGAVIAANDNWQQAANAAQIQASGFAPNHSLEPAIMMSLAPGAYTAIVQGVASGTGVGLVGVFTAP
jgi:hypothetical protein